MKNQYILFILILTCHTIYGQKPMVGYTPSQIKQRNYVEFNTNLDSWIIKGDSRGNETILSTKFTINGVFDLASISYFFKNNTEVNYQCIIYTYNKIQYLDFKRTLMEKSTYDHNGWYKTNSAGLFVKFYDDFYLKDKVGISVNCIIYKGEID